MLHDLCSAIAARPSSEWHACFTALAKLFEPLREPSLPRPVSWPDGRLLTWHAGRHPRVA